MKDPFMNMLIFFSGNSIACFFLEETKKSFSIATAAEMGLARALFPLIPFSMGVVTVGITYKLCMSD